MQEYPFSADEVGRLLGLQKRRENMVSIDFDCPFCGRLGKFNIHKQHGVCHCNYCGAAYNLVSLYTALQNKNSYRDAYNEICESLHCNKTTSHNGSIKISSKEESIKTFPCADLRTRHNTYMELLSLLTLSNENRISLLKRGLSMKQIEEGGYKSLQVDEYAGVKIAEQLLKRGCTLQGVPGFYISNNGQWTMRTRCSGILIPYQSVDGLIQAFQIRLNVPFYDGTKYIWLSSSMCNNGADFEMPVHYAGDITGKVLYITEGALKATIAHHLLGGRAFVALPGVGLYKLLLKEINTFRKYNVKGCVEAMDMDKYVNENVMKGCLAISYIMKQNGFPLLNLSWNRDYKGIDDCNFERIVHQAENVNYRKYDIDYRACMCMGKEYSKFINTLRLHNIAS